MQASELVEFHLNITRHRINHDLVLRGELNARINVETGPGGDITNNLTDDAIETKFPATSNLDIRSGDSSGRINIRTVSGDINLDGAN